MKIGGLREDILFKSKEYPLALPKKDSRGDFVFPPGTPLKRPKGGCGPPLESPRGTGDGGVAGFEGCQTVSSVIPYFTGAAQRQAAGYILRKEVRPRCSFSLHSTSGRDSLSRFV